MDGAGCGITISPASFDPYEPGGIKTVREDGVATTICNGTNPGHHNAVCATIENHKSGAQVREATVAPTMGAARNASVANDNPLVVAKLAPVGMKDNAGASAHSMGEHEGVMPSLTTDCGAHQSVAVPFRRSTCLTPGDPITKRVYSADGPAPTLQGIAEGSGVSAQAFVLPQDADGLPEVVVRRLTPTECERLMGLPSGWTRVTFTPEQIADPALVAYFRRVHDDWQKMIADDGKTPKPKTEAFVRDWLTKISDPATCPDAPRFKVCGNGWATNCPRWILPNLLRAEGVNPWYREDGE